MDIVGVFSVPLPTWRRITLVTKILIKFQNFFIHIDRCAIPIDYFQAGQRSRSTQSDVSLSRGEQSLQ